MGMTRVLVVDDSALMRRHLRDILERLGGCEVALARNGVEALATLATFNPDVVTLDVNMPEMDGLTCLSHIMTSRPLPVVMVSSLTEEGAEITLQALALGAVDFIQKPEGTISLNVSRIEREILAKVSAAAGARVRRSIGLSGRLRAESGQGDGRRERAAPTRAGASPSTALMGVVVIGVSTGGPGTLEMILPRLPATFPWPVVVAQHMPGSFTTVFARRLNDACAATVVEASAQMPLEPGVIYIGKGDADVVIGRRATRFVINPMPAGAQYLWHPSVARLVDSALHTFPAEQVVGVMLTGMGDDGAEPMAELARRGGRTIAQDEASSVVWGMPGELVKRGGASLVLPAERIAAQLCTWLPPAAASREKRHGSAQG